MDFRNRKFVIFIRTLLGLFFVYSGVSGLWAGTHDMQTIPGPILEDMRDLWSMNVFQTIKIAELVAGLMLAVGILPAFALLLLTPVCVGYLMYNLTIAPSFLPAALGASLLTAYLGYAYWDKYKAIFQR